MPFNCASMAAGEATSPVAGLSKAFRSASTVFNCSSRTSKPIQLADDLRLQVHRQRLAVAYPQVLQPLTPTLAQRLVAEHPLGEEQPFDPVDVPHPLAHQRPALAADTPAVLLLRCRRPGHRTHPLLIHPRRSGPP